MWGKDTMQLWRDQKGYGVRVVGRDMDCHLMPAMSNTSHTQNPSIMGIRYIYIQFLITMDWWPSPRWVYHPSKYPTMALSVSTWESGNLICTPVWRRLWHRSCLEQAGHGRGGHGGHGHGPRFGLAISPRMPLWLNKKHVWTRLIIHTIHTLYIYMYTCMVILCCTTYVY